MQKHKVMTKEIHLVEVSFIFDGGVIPETENFAVVLPDGCDDITPSGSTIGDVYYEIRVQIYPFSPEKLLELEIFMDEKYGRHI